jgi:hypothetical protein
MNIEQLKAMSHTEINKLCAIKVMGFKYRGYLEERPDYPYVSPNPQGKLVLYETDNDGYWNPTEDMSDAMTLVNKLNDRLFSIYANPEWSSSERFTVHVSKNSMAVNTVELDMNELPIAICYASILSIAERHQSD